MKIPALSNPKNHPLIIVKNLRLMIKVLDFYRYRVSEALEIQTMLETMEKRIFKDYLDVTNKEILEGKGENNEKD